MVEIQSLLLKKKAVFLDLDGVIYAGDDLIPGADRAVQWMREQGIHVRFLSNNSLKLPSSISQKLKNIGIDCPTEHVFTSGFLACSSLGSILDPGTTISVVGTDELKQMVSDANLVPSESDSSQVVLVGMTREFRYEQILFASRSIHGGARFFACNRDGLFIGEGGKMFAGCGAMVGAIEGATGVSPHRCFGKPDVGMLEAAMSCGSWSVDECIMIGDTWTSDIAMAQAAGMDWVFIQHEASKLASTFRSIRSLSEIVTPTETTSQ